MKLGEVQKEFIVEPLQEPIPQKENLPSAKPVEIPQEEKEPVYVEK